MTTPHRKTFRRYDVAGHARFLTFSCQNRLPLFDDDEIKRTFVRHLARSRERTGFTLITWVIMPEHVHLLIVTALPETSTEDVLKDLKGHFAREILERWRRDDDPILARITSASGKQHFWLAGGGYDRNIISPRECREKIDYMHMNPVTRGLVDRPSEWRWSSAGWYAGDRDSAPIDIDPYDP